MKATLTLKPAIAALTHLCRVAEKNSSKPILACVLMEADAEKRTLRMTATNYDMMLTLTLPADVQESGMALVSGIRLRDQFKTASETSANLSLDNKLWLTVETEGGTGRLPGVEVGLFPKEIGEVVPQGGLAYIGAPYLLDCFARTMTFSHSNETRKNLMGVHVSASAETGMRFTATDGHRLIRMPVDCEAEGKADMIVPRMSLDVLTKLKPPKGEVAELRWDEKNLTVAWAGMWFSMRLIEGQFPNVDPVIPVTDAPKALIPVKPFVAALEAIAKASPDKIKPVKLTINGQIALASERAEFGDVQRSAPCEYTGPEYVIGCNAVYVLAVLESLGADTVAMQSGAPLTPMLFTTDTMPGLQAVVMPLQIEW